MGNPETVQAALDALYESSARLAGRAFRGGYGGIYSVADGRAWGEAAAQPLQHGRIWLQPPGTPTIGEGYLRSYALTGDGAFLAAATDVGRAIAEAQRESGGWFYTARLTDPVRDPLSGDSNPLVMLDDMTTTGPIDFLVRLDAHVDQPWLTRAIGEGLDFLAEVQSPLGGWKHTYPAAVPFHDYFTFGDDVQASATISLVEAYRLWDDAPQEARDGYLESARLGADFILAAQLDDLHPGWSQYYDSDLNPVQGRSIEIPAAVTRESAPTMLALLAVYEFVRDPRYLEAARKAAEWLRDSAIEYDPDGNPVLWTRYYELGTNRPIYAVTKDGEKLYSPEEVEAAKEAGTWVRYSWTTGEEIPQAIAWVDEAVRDIDNFYANIFHAGALATAAGAAELEASAAELAAAWAAEGWEFTGLLDEADTTERFFRTYDNDLNSLALQQYLTAARDAWIAEGRGAEWEALVAGARLPLATGERPLDLAGSDDPDDLLGGAMEDVLRGGGGLDRLSGGGGADRMYGGAGDDRYSFEHSGDRAIELAGEGRDSIYASVVSVILPNHVEDVLLFGTRSIGATGNDAANSLNGNAAANRLDGRGGSDSLSGGLGNDSYFVDVAGDRVIEAAHAGFDRVYSTAGYALRAGQHVEVLSTASNGGTAAVDLAGNELANRLIGNDGANALRGRDGNDALSGLGGADMLVGGAGGDSLFGGAGADRFVYLGHGDSVKGGYDRVRDFESGADRIDLGAIDAVAATPANEGFAFIGDAAFSGHSGELRWRAVSGAFVVEGDVDGDRQADLMIWIAGAAAPASTDFLL